MIHLKILTYICVPLIIGYVTVVVAKRREVEMDVRRDFMSRRIEAYVAIHAFMRRSSLMIAPPMYMEGILFSCLNGTGFEIGDQRSEYGICFPFQGLLKSPGVCQGAFDFDSQAWCLY